MCYPSDLDITILTEFFIRRWLNLEESVKLEGFQVNMGFPSGSVVKNPLAIQETQKTWVRSLGLEDPLKEGMATHSSVLAWRIPWTEKPGGLQSMGSHRVRHDWSALAAAAAAFYKKNHDKPNSVLKSRVITLLTKDCIVEAMVFPIVMFWCESWTIKKAEHQWTDAFKLWCWRRLLRVPGTARISNQS